MQIFKFLGKISSWFVVRLTCFVLLIAIARDVSGLFKGLLWFLAFLTAAWAYMALHREARKAPDYIVPKIQGWAVRSKARRSFRPAARSSVFSVL